MRGFKSHKLEKYFTLGHIIDETFYTVELMHACVRRLQAQALFSGTILRFWKTIIVSMLTSLMLKMLMVITHVLVEQYKKRKDFGTRT